MNTQNNRYQSEAELERTLVQQLTTLGYARVTIDNIEQLHRNLKQQLERHNGISDAPLSDAEFAKVLNHLEKGNVFAKAQRLRDRFQLTRDDGNALYLQFLNTEKWCQNEYQVTHQTTVEGVYKNRYDVTLLINGLPLVQIELKRRGMELKEAFNQINRYQRHSFWAQGGLFQYVQLFVISNGVNTKYYANNRKQSFKQTFFWANEHNELITRLDAFAEAFLEKCHVSKMVCQYIVLHQTHKILMVLRPYQYYAAEAIVQRVEHHPRKHGYIWHTTGSGKTLTSFKAAQTITQLPKVDKVLFVVDRADLDYQTNKEFDAFSKGCVDETSSTHKLVEHLNGEKKLVVTTIQKLNNAITRDSHETAMQSMRDKRVVLIFDECHRSQFGDTHKNITQFFKRAQMFGFTGTPIFADNANRNEHGKRTTADLFGECLHRYVITNAIADGNVLRFAIEYWGKLKAKDGSLIDENVSSINKKEFFESTERIEQIVDWIIAHHNSKTHQRVFSAMLAVSSIDALRTYYELFAKKKAADEHDLRVVTIFTYSSNEDDADANGLIEEPDFDFVQAGGTDVNSARQHSRDVLAGCVADYNAMYKTNHSVKDSKAFYAYYKDIAKRMKEREKESFNDTDRADILLVVSMYLTGFDAKKINTMYVDKNLRQHGLIQAFSRTNRVLDAKKSHGNIVCFRNLKAATDDAITLFSNTESKEQVLLEPYEDYVQKFNVGVEALLKLTPTPDAVNTLDSEKLQLAFVKAFRELMRLLNILKPFSEFSWSDLSMNAQLFEDFKSKYLDLYDQFKTDSPDAASILGEVDFELELIHKDEVNVDYILTLLARLVAEMGAENKRHAKDGADDGNANQLGQSKTIAEILKLLDAEPKLRSKRELIEEFIDSYLPNISNPDNVPEQFQQFWSKQRMVALEAMSKEEDIPLTALQMIVGRYVYSGKPPLRDELLGTLATPPTILQRKSIYERLLEKIQRFVEKFEDAW